MAVRCAAWAAEAIDTWRHHPSRAEPDWDVFENIAGRTHEQPATRDRSTFLKKRLMSIVGDEVDVRFFVAEAMAP